MAKMAFGDVLGSDGEEGGGGGVAAGEGGRERRVFVAGGVGVRAFAGACVHAKKLINGY